MSETVSKLLKSFCKNGLDKQNSLTYTAKNGYIHSETTPGWLIPPPQKKRQKTRYIVNPTSRRMTVLKNRKTESCLWLNTCTDLSHFFLV